MNKKTPFYECHLKHRGKMIEFASWLLPVEFVGLIKEHVSVRTNVGIFDVSHMGEIEIRGEGALNFLQRLTTNDVSKLQDGQVQYSLLCYPEGGIVDDILVHRFSEKHFFICVNASNIEKDYNWLTENNKEDVIIENSSELYSQLAIQGPNAAEILQKITSVDLDSISRYWFTKGDVAGLDDLIIARTGYTGEDGFEIYSSPEKSKILWDGIFEAGKEFDVIPCGLGARDTLRLEVRYPLYGNDIDQTTNPFEAGLSWVVSKKKGDFLGRSKIFEKKDSNRKLVGIGVIDQGIPRKGYEIFNEQGIKVGLITSGTYSPTLKKSIALGYVDNGYSSIDTGLLIGVRGRHIKATVIKTPFVISTSLDKFIKK